VTGGHENWPLKDVPAAAMKNTGIFWMAGEAVENMDDD
jgi:hypothetical protein